MDIQQYITKGGFYVDHNFLEPDVYETLNKKFDTYEYEAIYQPYGIYYGNRYQAFPVYETKEYMDKFDPELDQLIYNKIQDLFDGPIQNWHLLCRYSITEEVLKSKKNTRYHPPHTDKTDCAGVLYLDQTSSGGTAFYRTHFDTEPDIEIGACPNRMICYSGQMLHSPSNDFTFEKRKTISFFFDYPPA